MPHPQVIIPKISENVSALAEYSSLNLLSMVSIKVHAGPSTPSPLVYLQDSLSSSKFLVDSGASILVFSSSTIYLKVWCQPAYCRQFFTLLFWFTHNFSTFGNHSLDLPFQLALVAIPILGADFQR